MFERVAERVSNLSSSPSFFAVCSVLVVAWVVSYATGLSVEVRSFLGDLLAAVTLALVALIKNAERRAEHAIQFKLDAIAQALLEMRAAAGDAETVEALEQAVGRHEEV